MRFLANPLILVLGTLLAPGTAAQEILVDTSRPPENEGEITRFYLPYAFYNETYELALGFLYAETGRFQEQLSFYASGIGSSNESYQALLGVGDLRLPWTDRWYMTGFGTLGKYSNLRAYVDGNPEYPDSRAGSNDSDPDDYIRGEAHEVWVELPFRYLLPIGGGEDSPHTYVLNRGILTESSTYRDVWNPYKSGRSYAILEPFFRRQEFDEAPSRGNISTSGLTVALGYDNTDFRRNPGAGSRQLLSASFDPGLERSTNSWAVVEFENSKYIPLRQWGWQRHRVLALNFWTADTPTWEDTQTASGVETTGAPPYFRGATLGGLRRMRAFSASRFNDQAAIYYAAEYRVIPSWQPLPEESRLRRLQIDWMQLVGFAELGRVADSWNLQELHTDMKWSVGVGLRIMARKQVFRIDLAVAEETWAILLDLVQPF